MGGTVHETPEDITLVFDDRPVPSRSSQGDGVRPVPAGHGAGQRCLEIPHAIRHEKGAVPDALHDLGRSFEIAVEMVVEAEGEPQRNRVALSFGESGEAAEVEKANSR